MPYHLTETVGGWCVNFYQDNKDQRNVSPLHLYVIRDSHCIHVDPKASESTKKAISNLIECYKYKYPNTSIFAAADPVPVYWGHFSVLEVR